jgi:transcription elongation GreA/GreB family factor
MSRAFVKDTDEVPELPDRPVSEHPNLVTERGLQLIEAEVLRHRAAFAEAQASGDRAKITAAQRELRYWDARRASAQVQEPPADYDAVRFGCRVTIERDPPPAKGRAKQTFRIVGEDEADPAAGTLSYVSPLAQALLGKEVGDEVTVGPGKAEILAIKGGA